MKLKFLLFFGFLFAFTEQLNGSSFLCDHIHIARALGFKQRISTLEFYWLSFYKAGAIDARNFCVRMGAELVHIKDEGENMFLKSILANETEVWTAGVHAGNGVYKWLTGFNMTYTNWLKSEPSGQKTGAENYVSIYGGAGNKNEKWGFWNDNVESAQLRTLCVIRCPRGVQ